MATKNAAAGLSSSSSSAVWLKGVLCSPSRLPLAVLFTAKRIVDRKLTAMGSSDAVILGILAASVAGVVATLGLLQSAIPEDLKQRTWMTSLTLNLLGYSTVFLPGYLIITYVRRSNYFEKNNGGRRCLHGLVRMCVKGKEETLGDSLEESLIEGKSGESGGGAAGAPTPAATPVRDALHLLSCFAGLQVAYLTWGVLQEKIMTTHYTNSSGETGRFADSQFLVFVNRILAFAVALLYISVSRQPRHKAPLFKYSFCSLSNIMSSWCQYEVLKYVGFPTQVLAKASKIIPVMIMGRIISGRRYEFYEYVVAGLISVGMAAFIFGSGSGGGGGGGGDGEDNSTATTFSGVILLVGYMVSDSFTSNWQSELFSAYKMSSVQMMVGVNLFSCLLTSASLTQQGVFYTSLTFMSQFPKFTVDCIVLSFCSALGQLFIYHTISVFGPVVFVMIMTLRQAFAILLSCLIYHHPLTVIGIIGVLIVFSAIFLKIYCGYRLKKMRAAEKKLSAADSGQKV